MAPTRKCAFARLRGGNFPVRLVAIHISPMLGSTVDVCCANKSTLRMDVGAATKDELFKLPCRNDVYSTPGRGSKDVKIVTGTDRGLAMAAYEQNL
jgi:hypothetical protein